MKKLKIRTYGMFGTSHSWALTMRNLILGFQRAGHDLYINTTNGIEGVPKEWYKYCRDCKDPDIDICYTLPQNFPHRFSGMLPGTSRAKLRLGVYNYESSLLPQGWAEYHKYVDYLLPSSEYVRDIFLRAGIPDEKIAVLPLGMDIPSLNGKLDEFDLKTKKKFKLLNISIPHVRKNLPYLIDAYFAEFSEEDDICLIIKTTLNQTKLEGFEVNVNAIVEEIKKKYPDKKLPELELIEFKFNNMGTIYKKCDALINTAASEGFGLPLLEAMACGSLVAAPRYGGVLDFLDSENSLLIDTIEVQAGPEYQYWKPTPGATVGHPVKESIMKTMRNLYENKDELHNKFDKHMAETVQKYTWDNSAKIVLDLYDGILPKKQLGEWL